MASFSTLSCASGWHCCPAALPLTPHRPLPCAMQAVRNGVVNLSSHPYGCRVVQRVMEHCDMPRVLEAIVGDILANSMALAADQYGNYVIQHTLINGPPHARWVPICLLVLCHRDSVHGFTC